MAAVVDLLVIPLALPFLLLWLAVAQLVACVAPLTILPTVFLAHRLYWAVPIASRVWKKHGIRGSWLRVGFEVSYCCNVVRRFLTLPLRTSTPEFYILGWPECGTGELAAQLLRHPALSSVDGLPWHPALAAQSYFFSGVLGRKAGASSPTLYRSFFPTLLTRWWRERVRRCGRWMCFDACPLHACLPFAAKRIAAITPAAKLVFMVRDPLEAAFATEIMLRNTGLPIEWSLMEDVKAADPRFADGPDDARFWAELESLGVGEPLPADLPRRLYLRCSTVLRCANYAERARPFLDLFPRENVMFLEYDEFMAQPEAAVHEVLKFVGADPGMLRFQPPAEAPPQADERGRRMHPSVRRKLQHYFTAPNQRLFALLGREFPWGQGPAADEEEGGGGGDFVAAAAAALHRSIAALRGKVPVDPARAAQLMPAQKVAPRKDSGLVKRVVSINART